MNRTKTVLETANSLGLIDKATEVIIVNKACDHVQATVTFNHYNLSRSWSLSELGRTMRPDPVGAFITKAHQSLKERSK